MASDKRHYFTTFGCSMDKKVVAATKKESKLEKDDEKEMSRGCSQLGSNHLGGVEGQHVIQPTFPLFHKLKSLVKNHLGGEAWREFVL